MGTLKTGDFHQTDVSLSVKLGASGQCSYRLRSKKQHCSLIQMESQELGKG